MGIQLRIMLPDQPGALARATQALARTGADVISVAVLESEAGRAVDDFRLRWPTDRDPAPLVAALDECPGLEVLGCRRTRWLLDGRPDLDLLTHLLAVPERGMETLIDMAPAALDADWAELRAPARRLPVLYGTAPTPHDERAPESMPVRAQAATDGDCAYAYLPMAALGSVLVLGRDGGPPFLRAELANAERVVELAVRTIEAAVRPARMSAPPSELTAHLAMARTA